jgi:quaternary ammonium compound-resistance protein SugE
MFEWMMLLIASICEIVWAQSLKFSDVFSKTVPTIFTIIFGVLSCYFLALATRSIPLGIAYAIWSGIGGAGILILGCYLHGEVMSLPQLFFVSLILAGVIGVKLSSC